MDTSCLWMSPIQSPFNFIWDACSIRIYFGLKMMNGSELDGWHAELSFRFLLSNQSSHECFLAFDVLPRSDFRNRNLFEASPEACSFQRYQFNISFTEIFGNIERFHKAGKEERAGTEEPIKSYVKTLKNLKRIWKRIPTWKRCWRFYKSQ